jgi:membrane fusion protein, multidrug efflux system
MVAIVRRHPRVFLAVALGALVAAPFVFGLGTSAKAAQGAPQAVPVNVARVEPHDVQLWSQFSGRLNAVDSAEIRPEVGGRITEIRFQDGQIVKAGQILLVIDPRPYEAALAKARADLASARANAALARNELERGNGLIKANAIARSMYDQRVNANQVAIANVAVAQAVLHQAEVDVDHAYVKAPISGRISRPELTVGNLVQSAPNAPLLASIVSNDGIYADFEVDEQTYLNTVHARAETAADEQQLPVEMTLQGAEGRVYKGTVYSFDNKIDTSSGTIRARAKFDNADGSLVPGMFVSVRLGAGDHRNAITVPERAIVADLNKKFVYVVGKDDKAEMREVKLGATNDGERMVLGGLKTGVRVIVDGVQHIALGVPVSVQSKVASR